MCLLAIAWKTHPTWRLLMAGNRDEFHPRPAVRLAPWPDHAGVLAGRDLQSGGTWAGVGRGGRMAVVTNVRRPAAPLPGGPSRGALVADYLAGSATARSHADAVAASAALFAPFNLLLADADDCEYVGSAPGSTRLSLPPGIYGMSNGAFDAPWPKAVALKARLADWLASGTTDVAPLWNALADETVADDAQLPDTGVGIALERRLAPAFIRGADYGTRASTLIAIHHDGRGWIAERRFGLDGVFEGETTVPFG